MEFIRRPGFWIGVTVAALLALQSAVGLAAERIHGYEGKVVVHRDSSLEITEAIDVTTDEELYWFGRLAIEAFESNDAYQLQSATIDGKEADLFAGRLEDGRLQFAVQRKDVSIVPPGRHRYTITYLLKNHISYRLNHDEITLNITGSEWGVPIERVRVQLDFDMPIEGVTGGKGWQGAKETSTNSVSLTKRKSSLDYVSTAALAPGQGFYINAEWPKGYIQKAIDQSAAERITDFHSDVQIDAQGGLLVKETIRVISAHQQINHGIYRDFPTQYELPGSKWLPSGVRSVGFDLLEVTCDGRPEEHMREALWNGVRIYIGKKDEMVEEGEHVYTITYRTDRQLGLFEDHDELYWNVTGNDWSFPIDKASAVVRLPADINAEAIKAEGYTGVQGSVDQDLKLSVRDNGTIDYGALNPLALKEGLTIVAAWPKGYIAEPEYATRLLNLMSDYLMLAVSAVLVVLILSYYTIAWLIVGRDPQKGVIQPLYTPPEWLSPAAARYIAKMGCDNKAYVAFILDLAVKGYVKIREENGTFVVEKQEAVRKGVLTGDERDGFEDLPERMLFQSEERNTVYRKYTNFEEELERRYAKYFKTNRNYLFPGLVMSLFAVAIAAFAHDVTHVAYIITTIVLTPLVVGTILFLKVARRWYRSGSKSRTIMALVILAILLNTGWWIVSGFEEEYAYGNIPYYFLLVWFVVLSLNVLFYYLLRTRSREGRQLMDNIEGFKLYMSAVDGDRLDRMNPPEKTPELFEKYLPYALALDLELRWAEQFTEVYALSNVNGRESMQSPAWFLEDGRKSTRMDTAAFASHVSSALSVAVSSSAVAPGSSSGMSSCSSSSFGSSGSSGGGGGGGW